MNAAVPDSLVTEYEDLIDSLQLTDPDNRHVLAIAIRADADAIITFNQRDFDEAELAKYDVYTEHPDEFVSNMIARYTPLAIFVVREMRGRLRKTSEKRRRLHSMMKLGGDPPSKDCSNQESRTSYKNDTKRSVRQSP